MAKKKVEEEYDVEAEEVEGEFLEIALDDLAKIIADQPHYDGDWRVENNSKPGKYRFWLNTPMGFREVDRIYVRLSDVVVEQKVEGPVN